jgi:cobalt/nickel transport system permease protein
MEEKQVALAGLVAAFIFAVQMLNFPVAAGTSGHLIGGVLAAVLVGPWAGALCVSVVLMVQALFADGGLTALGLNIVNMAFVTALGGYAIFALLRKVLPATRSSIVVASGIAAGLSVVLSAAAFVLEFALGGTAPVSVSAVLSAMLGVHLLIGVGEGIITAATVSLVLGVRPDLVYGASDLPVSLHEGSPSAATVS